MAGKDNNGPACRRLLEFFIPQNSRGLCRSREKQLFLLALGTISFLCFGSIWFLPDKPGSGGKVKVVRDFLEKPVEEMILPPPPQDMGQDANNVNPNIRHGVIDKPDHRAEENGKLKAQIEMDEEIERIRQHQEKQVLAKPNMNLDNNKESKKSSSAPQMLDNNFAKPANKDKNVPDKDIGAPKIQGGEDADEVARKRREHVKGVS